MLRPVSDDVEGLQRVLLWPQTSTVTSPSSSLHDRLTMALAAHQRSMRNLTILMKAEHYAMSTLLPQSSSWCTQLKSLKPSQTSSAARGSIPGSVYGLGCAVSRHNIQQNAGQRVRVSFGRKAADSCIFQNSISPDSLVAKKGLFLSS